MKPIGWVIGAAAICVLLGAEDVFAWGPATHVGLGLGVLDQLALVPAALAALLTRHRSAFLYGNIAADVVFAKRLSHVKQFCHHWSTGFRLLESARDDRGKSFAYGYLAHLAADTVAHGKYVPRQVMMSECSVNFGHFFWELRADSAEPERHRRTLKDLSALEHEHHHLTLESHLTGTFLPYEWNRILFDQLNSLAAGRSLRAGVGLWNLHPRWYLAPDLIGAYRSESLDRILSLFVEGDRSAVVRDDPNGSSALMHASVRRREVRKLKRVGIPVGARVLESAHGLSPLPKGTRPTTVPILPVTSAFGRELTGLKAD